MEVFESIIQALRKYGLSRSTRVYAVCKGEKETAGIHPETKEPLKWAYYDEYILNKNS